jgi:hypothetical protein
MDDALAAATALLAHNTAYHNHKEQMAYVGAAAYIGAAPAFTFFSSGAAPLAGGRGTRRHRGRWTSLRHMAARKA